MKIPVYAEDNGFIYYHTGNKSLSHKGEGMIQTKETQFTEMAVDPKSVVVKKIEPKVFIVAWTTEDDKSVGWASYFTLIAGEFIFYPEFYFPVTEGV